jgi:hypothetical protein
MACRLFSQNTRGWGISTAPDVQAFQPSKRVNSFLYKSLQPLLHRKKANSFAIKQIQPLFQNTRVGVSPVFLYLATSLRRYFWTELWLTTLRAAHPPSRAIAMKQAV